VRALYIELCIFNIVYEMGTCNSGFPFEMCCVCVVNVKLISTYQLISVDSSKLFVMYHYTRAYPKVSGLAAWSENCK
jgi:hypothetical protein